MKTVKWIPWLVACATTVVLADDAKKLTFDTPKEWKASEIKAGGFAPKQQWTLAKVEGDDEDATVSVYHFDGGGGSLDDNVKRWCGQYKTAEGKPVKPDDVKKETFESNGIKITLVEIAGTHTPPAFAGGGGSKENRKLLAAYVDAPGGPWFVKLQGPAKSVDKHADAYRKWLKTAKIAEK